MDKKELGFECEKAIRFLNRYMLNDGWKKPALSQCRGMGEKKNAYVAQKGFANLENNWDLAEIFNVVILGLPAFDAYLERANSEGLVSTT